MADGCQRRSRHTRQRLDRRVCYALGEAGQAGDVEGLDPEQVADSIEELQALGYLESVVEVPTASETACLLELRLPN
ncbi:hypothetical protein CH256_17450 [Rhodococcus sp. 05-2254-6]|nr:hypothetical protein CH256_17450 [Rhodococcus sp. 05-2254-6]